MLTRLNQVMHGWANYFRHAIAKNVFAMLDNFAWWRVIRMLMERHRWRWKDVRRRFTTPTGRWLPITAGEIELRRIAAIPVTRYRYRGSKIPSPWTPPNQPDGRNRGEPVASRGARRVRREAGETGREQSRNRAPGRLSEADPPRQGSSEARQLRQAVVRQAVCCPAHFRHPFVRVPRTAAVHPQISG